VTTAAGNSQLLALEQHCVWPELCVEPNFPARGKCQNDHEGHYAMHFGSQLYKGLTFV